MNAKFFSLLIATLIITLATCFHTITSVKNITSQNISAKDASYAQLEFFNDRLTKLELKINGFQDGMEKIIYSQNELAKIAENIKNDDSSGKLNDYLLSVNQALYKLEDLIQTSGLQDIATNDTVDSAVLGDMYEQQLQTKNFKKYQEDMTTVFEKQELSDFELYGKEIFMLSRSIKTAENDDEKQRLIDELLTEYPDSYAAGNAIANLALIAMEAEEFTAVQEYYQQMQAHDKYKQALLPYMKMKVCPVVLHQIAQKYVIYGKYEEAENILSQLQQFENDHVISDRPEMQSVPNAVQELRQRIKDKE